MLVFWQERLVLFAVPKTGTTAIEGFLAPRAAMILRNPPTIKHMQLSRYNRTINPLIENSGGEGFETLAVIREPVSWLSSWYRYRHREDLIGHANSTRGITFDHFVTEYLNDKPLPYAKVGKQASYVFDGDGKRETTLLSRYENQDGLIEFLEQRLNMRITLPRLNISPEIETSLSPEIEARFRRERPLEFEAWEMAL